MLKRSRFWRVLEWIGVHQPIVLLLLAVVFGGVWGFSELSDDVMEGETQKFDEAVLQAMRKPVAPGESAPVGPEWLAEAALDVTALGGMTIVALVTAISAGYLLLERRYGLTCVVLAASVGGAIIALVLKEIIDRERPSVIEHLAVVHTASFPSGHSMLSAVVYLTLGTLLAAAVPRRRVKAYFLGVALLLTLLVGLTRVYLGVHYPT
ncbi:MAG: phosphatase PAP2 family protein, partial [Planctomycetaceae bacterium]